MKHLLIALLMMTILSGCKKEADNKVEDRTELIPEPDKDLRENSEKEESKMACSFTDPDTSIADLKIRNAESVLKTLGKQSNLEGGSPVMYYSADKKQQLSLTVHPGDGSNQVSIFNVSYAEDPKQKYGSIKSNEFKSEKGIKLGITKKDIVSKLGNCYVAEDSIATGITLSYSLELPNDSKTGLLKYNNMPLYFARYRLKNDKLESFEFGFENP